jgi:putative salt-induced outer membrane protein YdiY
VVRAVALSASFAAVIAATPACAYEIPKNLKQGWDGTVELGALATFGATDTSALSARAAFTFSGQHIEHELIAKLYRSSSESFVIRRDAEGNELLDSNGFPIRDIVNNTTNDRRFIGVQPRWFFTQRHYVFALADVEFNEPADIESSTRQVGGIGYKLWKSRRDYVSAAVGIGRKKLVQVSGESEEGAIGYVGVRFKRNIAQNVSWSIDLDSDFGGENRFSEGETSLSWKLRRSMAIKLKYEARFNSNLIRPLNRLDEGIEAALSINLEVEVF